MRLSAIFLFLFPLFVFSQGGDDWFDNIENISDNVEEPILLYEKYNAFTMGDSVRICNKRPCNGIIKDYWENGNLKHKAYYRLFSWL